MDLFGRYAGRPGLVDNLLGGLQSDRLRAWPLSRFGGHGAWPGEETCCAIQDRSELLLPDGPRETDGVRYRINPASLRFIPVDQLESKGYGSYRHLFQASEEEVMK